MKYQLIENYKDINDDTCGVHSVSQDTIRHQVKLVDSEGHFPFPEHFGYSLEMYNKNKKESRSQFIPIYGPN